MEFERILLLGDAGHGIVLVGDGEGDPDGGGTSSLNNDILGGGPGSAVVASQAQTEGELLVVRGAPVAKELLRSNKVSNVLDGLQGDGLLEGCGLGFNGRKTVLHRLPIVRTTVEIACDQTWQGQEAEDEYEQKRRVPYSQSSLGRRGS